VEVISSRIFSILAIAFRHIWYISNPSSQFSNGCQKLMEAPSNIVVNRSVEDRK
jgi:hypothetical protein